MLAPLFAESSEILITVWLVTRGAVGWRDTKIAVRASAHDAPCAPYSSMVQKDLEAKPRRDF